MKKQADCNLRVPDRIFTETILKQELPDLLEALCRIPAPSGQEDGRIAFIGDRLHEYGIPFFVDAAKNLLIFFGPQDTTARKRILLSAHTDTVFPDTKPMPLTRDEERICCPGAGDNTACAAILLLYLKYARQALEQSPKPLLFAFNSCEEGLGNLKGIRRIMETYGDRIQEATAFDGGVSGVCREAVGSLRYQVTIRTRGGHSFNDFGNASAVEAMTDLIQRLYRMPLPEVGKNTYNVGTIQGGTSVNSIPQSCTCLLEYRSDCRESLAAMKNNFQQVLHHFRQQRSGLHMEMSLMGERPCSGRVNRGAMEELVQRAVSSISAVTGEYPSVGSGSTDCNIPLSMGIPAVCFGGLVGDGVHTREEYVSLPALRQEARIIEEYLRRTIWG